MTQTLLPAAKAGGLTATELITGSGSQRPVSLHTIRFTGSGSEYFRIWIINLMLMVLTFGLYYPWARVRKLRYFHGNTIVIGHPLDFHGNPRQMLRGFVLVSALMLLYGAAGRVSPESGMLAGLIVAAIWPALMRASLQFRLANTSWRGLRFEFTGSMKDAYMVFLGPMLFAAGTTLLITLLIAILPKRLVPATAPLAILLVVLALSALLGPYTLWRLKRYQHGHFALGQLQTTCKATFGKVLSIFTKTSLLGLASLLVLGLAWALVAGTLRPQGMPKALGVSPDKSQLTLLLLFFLGYLLITQVIVMPYFSSQMQNLVWTQTGNRRIRFKSHLNWMRMSRLALKNWLLVLVTLGFYWPFAAVALAKARLQAIVVHTRQDPDALIAQASQGRIDATGDLAADMVGVDVGL